jgi:hypothetical protein
MDLMFVVGHPFQPTVDGMRELARAPSRPLQVCL